MSQVRFYYKTKDGKGYLNLKTPDFDNHPDYDKISEEEWNAHIAELEALAEEQAEESEGK